jgi:integrase/recombinase XerD
MSRGERKTRESRRLYVLGQFPHIQHITDARGLYCLGQDFLSALRVRNYSHALLNDRELYLCELIDWCAQRQVFYPTHITKLMLERYQRTLFYKRKKNGEALSFSVQSSRLSAIKGWFNWLTEQDYIASNPASVLHMPRLERRLPKAILSEHEIETVLHQPNTNDVLGLRDRALLEVLYSTGIRRAEATSLAITDMDLAEGYVIVRQGKGKKDRRIPLGERAVAWVNKYLYEARAELSCARDKGELFLSAYGLGFNPTNLTAIVRKYIQQAGIHKGGSCHVFRHAMATHMLEHGADIRYIQEMLGHSNITTTQIYTQVSIKKLKEVHTQTHPAAELTKKQKALDVDLVSLEESEETLLAILKAEAHDESKP